MRKTLKFDLFQVNSNNNNNNNNNNQDMQNNKNINVSSSISQFTMLCNERVEWKKKVCCKESEYTADATINIQRKKNCL